MSFNKRTNLVLHKFSAREKVYFKGDEYRKLYFGSESKYGYNLKIIQVDCDDDVYHYIIQDLDKFRDTNKEEESYLFYVPEHILISVTDNRKRKINLI